MSAKYKTHTAALEEAKDRNDYWQILRLTLGQHEMIIQAEGTTGAGPFVSRSALLKAISDYAANSKEPK